MSAPAETAGLASDAPTPAAPRRGRLFVKYVVSLVGLVAVLLIGNGALDVWFSYNEAKQALVRIQQEKAEAAAQRIAEFVDEIERQIGWTTHAQWSAGTVDQRRFDYVRLLRQVPAITELAQLDSDGHEQLKVSRLAMDAVGSGTDYSQDPKFTQAVAHKVWFSPVYFRKESEPYMTIAVAHAGRKPGVTVADVNLKLIWDVVSAIKVGQAGYAYVVGSDGRLIAHPDISLVLRDTDLSGLPQVAAALANPAAAREPSANVTIAPNHAGVSVLTAHAAIPALNWLVFVELPASEALAPLYQLLTRSGILLGVGLLLAAVAGGLLARRMVVPIRRLQEGAERLGAGELGHRIELKTGDEIEALADRFNRMGAQLRDSYATLEGKVEARTHELTEALDYQTATSEVLRIVATSPDDLQPIFDAMLEKATQLCAAKFGLLMIYDGETYRTVAVKNLPPVVAKMFCDGPLRPEPTTATARVLQTKLPIAIEDLRQDIAYIERWPMRVALVEEGGARAQLVVPLLKKGEVIGAFLIYLTEPRPFADSQVALVTTFANQAVIAIENARLINETREALEQQTATADVLKVISSSPGELKPVFDKMLENALRLCEAKFGVLQLYEDGGFRIGAIHNAPPAFAEAMARREALMRPTPQHPFRRMVTTKAVVQIADLMESPAYKERDPGIVMLVERASARTFLAVPMVKENEVAGVIAIYRQEVRPFTDKQVAVVVNFANQAVIAIENARLLRELRERSGELARSVEELTTLREVGQAVSSTLDLWTVLETIVTRAVALAGADAGAIYRYRRTDRQFKLGTSYGLDDDLAAKIRGARIREDETMALRRAITERVPVQLPDLETAPHLPLRDLMVEAGFRAVLMVPLIAADRVFGVLSIQKKTPGEFPENTVKLMQTFASQSVLAIQNARLFREVEEQGRALALASQHKSQFLANMSHELRTPLNAVLGYAELLADGIYGELTEKARGVLERIQSNGKHLLGLINDVLDLSKIEAGQLTLAIEAYAVPAVVHSVVSATESLAKAKGLTLATDVPKDLPLGSGDERRLTQVILNLVGNAIKFTDKGSVVIAVTCANGRFDLAVSDTGPGIAEADQARIFEEFQQVDNSNTRRKGGTGLGLSISKKIVELHGGAITVESELGKGSTFHVVLPVSVAQEREIA